MKLRISVTKKILEESKMCGHDSYNCAIAKSCRDIFPNALVGKDTLYFDKSTDNVALPAIAQDFINEFDRLDPKDRVQMQPISFEVDVPDEVINRINIDEIEELLKNHPTLQFV